MDEERYEFGRPQDQQLALADGGVLPQRRWIVRRERGPDDWEDIGWVEVILVRVKNPPEGHAAVGVTVTVSVNLRPPP